MNNRIICFVFATLAITTNPALAVSYQGASFSCSTTRLCEVNFETTDSETVLYQFSCRWSAKSLVRIDFIPDGGSAVSYVLSSDERAAKAMTRDLGRIYQDTQRFKFQLISTLLEPNAGTCTLVWWPG